jgi:hypothetical protein
MSEPALLRPLCCVALLLLIIAPSAYAQRGGSRSDQPRRSGPGTRNPDEHLVPWKFIEKDVPPPKGPITLYWLPASLEEAERSRLMTSRALGEAATRCVDLEIIVAGSAAVVEKLGAAGKVPTALLADREGRVIRRAESVHGALRAEDVERMLADELSARDEAMYREMTEAKQQAGAGNKQAAIDLYKRIWDDRCLFPLAGNEAQRALKSLGVIVQEPPAVRPPDPNLQPPVKTGTGHPSL